MSISDRILLMHNGRMQQYATPEEMYRRPVNQFAAGFLGNPPINFVPCLYEAGALTVEGTPRWRLPLNRLQPCQADIQGPAMLGIRPEDLYVDDDGFCTAQILSIQPLGKEVYLKLEAGPHRLTACLSWDHDYRVGDTLPLAAKRLHLFPGQREEGGGDGAA